MSGIRAKSETELAVSAVNAEWLVECEGPVDPMLDNNIGNLLQDYANMAEMFAVCQARHRKLIEYLVPIVNKERGVLANQ